MIPRTIVEVHTHVVVRHGTVACEARPESERLLLRCCGNHWEIDLPVDQVLSVLEALGGAYDWRKRKLMETAVTGERA